MASHWHGILVINKERGMTSHKVVANLRHLLRQAEIGHTGTLDPEATGVLVVGLGQATRSFSFLKEEIKTYRAEIILGQATDTQDATGKIIRENRFSTISYDTIFQRINQFLGDTYQLPPMYSAVKVDGRKLYDLARQGMEVERTPRLIKIHSWKILNPKLEYGFRDNVFAEITCSKGTYIRTLIHDLGDKLGTGAHMGDLARLVSGEFRLEEAMTIAQVQESLEQGILSQQLISINTALAHLPALQLDEEDLVKVNNGGKISYQKYYQSAVTGALAKVLDPADRVVAIVELQDAGTHQYWQPVKVFRY